MIPAFRTDARRVATILSVVSASAALICTSALVLNWGEGRRERLAAEQAEQTQAVQSRAVGVVPSREELDSRTAASVARDGRAATLARLLFVSIILFLAVTKWRLALTSRCAPSMETVRSKRNVGQRRTSPSNGKPDIDAPQSVGSAADEAIDVSAVADIIDRIGRSKNDAIPLLQAIQERYRYLPEPALRHVCETTDILPAQLMSVATFYPQFRHTPAGAHIVRVCQGTACHVAGADLIDQEMRRHIGIDPGQDTDPQRRFTVESVACLGCCTRAPVVQVDNETYGPLPIEEVTGVLDEAETMATPGAPERAHSTATGQDTTENHRACEVRVGLGSCCVAGGSGHVFDAVADAIARAGGTATVKRVGCVGMCHRTPLVQIMLNDGTSALYADVAPGDARAIVQRHIRPQGLKPRLVNLMDRGRDLWAPQSLTSVADRLSLPRHDPPVAAFLEPQEPIATEHGGVIDPSDCDEYLRYDGFAALRRCLRLLTPDDVIEVVANSGLRGRGGAGFPVGQKWARVRQAQGKNKVIIANGDEGDPGAFMDRMLMESFPFRIIEGLIIAAYAVGAEEGVLYIRAEYPLAVTRIRDAIHQCEQRGLLGRDILGSGINLSLEIFEGAGAFVCGEETALIASIEGRRGMPRWRPPYPAASGLHGRPTLVNNVETLANLPWIVRHGAEAFASLGTEHSKGTKVFALAGKIKRGGLIEVPMGMTLRDIVEDIGGGVRDGSRFKAVQIGGPSGGCIPEALADTPVDYEALTKVGAIMGSGGLVVMDEADCMVDIARYFVAFTQFQSCGRCTHCRVGTRHMLDILEQLCEGRAARGDLERLETLANSVQLGSLCGLGRTAPNPVQTTLRYFREEYEAHLRGECPAGKCSALIGYRVTERCIGCTLCAQHCPVEAIDYRPYVRHEVDLVKCTRCGICLTTCPENAVEVMTSCPT